MTVSKKFKIDLMSVLAVLLIILSIYAYNNLGYTLSSKEAYQIAYQNAGVASKELLSKSFEKSRLGLKATYHITLKLKRQTTVTPLMPQRVLSCSGNFTKSNC